MLTAAVEYTSKAGISHAEYMIALIYYTFKPYLKYPVFLSMVCNFFSSRLNAVPFIPYVYIPSVLQKNIWVEVPTSTKHLAGWQFGLYRAFMVAIKKTPSKDRLISEMIVSAHA